MPDKGRPFSKGLSGNPGGRPKVLGDVQELAREKSPEAIETLSTIMRDEKAALLHGSQLQMRCLIAAMGSLLNPSPRPWPR